MWGGWYDIFLVGQIDAYNGYNTQANALVTHEHSLVIDPLGHCQSAAKFFNNTIAGRVVLPLLQLLEMIAKQVGAPYMQHDSGVASSAGSRTCLPRPAHTHRRHIPFAATERDPTRCTRGREPCPA